MGGVWEEVPNVTAQPGEGGGGREGREHMAEQQGEKEMELSNAQHPIYFCSLSSGLLCIHTATDYLCVGLPVCVCVCV